MSAPRSGRRLRVALAAILLAAGTLAPGPDPAAAAEEAPDAATNGPRVGYEVSIRVTDQDNAPDDLADRLDAVSTLKDLADSPPATRPGLRRRLESDVEAFRRVLNAEGHYGGSVSGEIEGGTPARVTITVTPGPAYTIGATRVTYEGDAPGTGDLPESLAVVGLNEGDQARADAVLTAERDLIEHLRARGRPFAEVASRRTAVNHARRHMAVRIVVAAGPPATFGAVRYEGLERVEAAYLDAEIPWRPGETFNRDQLDTFRTRVQGTRLFDSVTVRPADQPDADGRLPVLVSVSEAPPRSIGGGLRYATDEGPGVRLFWEHRNMFGRAEHFRADLDASLTAQALSASLDKPRFLHEDQSLTLSASVERSDRDAYQGLEATAGLGLDRRLNDTWRASAGVQVEYADLEDEEGPERSLLLALPMGVSRDDTDDPLNPTRGSRLTLELTPYAGQAGDLALGFVVTSLGGSAYWAPLESDRLVLAGRARVATLVGAALEDVPATTRLYAGGGGSVRGYGHQMVGPLDDDGDPLGGRSALDFGVEARIKVTDSIGIVPFLDAGLVSDGPWPDPGDEEIRWAAGLGGRYHTDFGPIRVDIGVPLNPRDEDDLFQIYISLGQAF
ncbi:autotransporter assembly complex family protein [uncultured Rhodospira sp.]|uniref:autotransporter assembly complex protein TamA n=1 Tax=uncultured Rhodospira sp. TaxID=1936189 RepID=UPI00262C4DBA|nr:autotransporter assembly complex family protein [uncultured Rhodospira sp.]